MRLGHNEVVKGLPESKRRGVSDHNVLITTGTPSKAEQNQKQNKTKNQTNHPKRHEVAHTMSVQSYTEMAAPRVMPHDAFTLAPRTTVSTTDDATLVRWLVG